MEPSTFSIRGFEAAADMAHNPQIEPERSTICAYRTLDRVLRWRPVML
jgi:hypothetical protein